MRYEVIMKVGSKTSLHLKSGAYAAMLGRMRCFSCRKKIVVLLGGKIQDLLWEDKFYCEGCILQVSHGIKMPRQIFNPIYWIPCPIEGCKKYRKRSFPSCSEHFVLVPSKNPPGTAKKLRRKIYYEVKRKPKVTDSSFNSHGDTGTLKKDLAFCQNYDCPDKKPLLRKEMYKMRVGNLSLRPMYFCSVWCKFVIKGENPSERYKEWV
jgi:hypothetical protein